MISKLFFSVKITFYKTIKISKKPAKTSVWSLWAF